MNGSVKMLSSFTAESLKIHPIEMCVCFPFLKHTESILSILEYLKHTSFLKHTESILSILEYLESFRKSYPWRRARQHTPVFLPGESP